MMKAKLFMALLAMMAMMTACSNEDNNGGKEEPAKKRLVEVCFNTVPNNNNDKYEYDSKGRFSHVIIKDSTLTLDGQKYWGPGAINAPEGIQWYGLRTNDITFKYDDIANIIYIDKEMHYPEQTTLHIYDTLYVNNGVIDSIYAIRDSRYEKGPKMVERYYFKYNESKQLTKVEYLYRFIGIPNQPHNMTAESVSLYWEDGNMVTAKHDGDNAVLMNFNTGTIPQYFKYNEIEGSLPIINVYGSVLNDKVFGLLSYTGHFGTTPKNLIAAFSTQKNIEDELWDKYEYTQSEGRITGCIKKISQYKNGELRTKVIDDWSFVWK